MCGVPFNLCQEGASVGCALPRQRLSKLTEVERDTAHVQQFTLHALLDIKWTGLNSPGTGLNLPRGSS
eukprot:9476963-Pyramimonas_sp.AAC.2